MYEVQVSFLSTASKGWRTNARVFVVTTDPHEAIRIAIEGLTEPKVLQLHWRTENVRIPEQR